MRIEYKGAALRDLQEKQEYVEKVLKNKAARKLSSTILRAVSLLAEHPMMGTPLNSKYDIDSDLRFIIVSKQLVFYQVVDDTMISVIRVLDGRQDYMAILFE